MGPLAGSQVLVKPLRKFALRVQDIKNAGASIAVNALDYNSRVLPVLTYVTQLVPCLRSLISNKGLLFMLFIELPLNFCL